MKNVFAAYKPRGVTSRKLLDQIQKITDIKKWGHAGTLDPLAEGVLVVGFNEGTKNLFSEDLKEKEYSATVLFGKTSNTDDEEGERVFVSSQEPELKDIEKSFY